MSEVIDISRYYNGVFREGKDTFLQTGSGKRVSVLNPQPEDIDINDIANAISKLCRFNGHCVEFYSVAQHSVLGANLADYEELAREFLLHDATEAYVGDIIRPVKVHIEQLEAIENRYHLAIARRFDLPLVMSDECKKLDDIMVTWEKQYLLPNSEVWPMLPDISDMDLPELQAWSMERSKELFLYEFENLFGE